VAVLKAEIVLDTSEILGQLDAILNEQKRILEVLEQMPGLAELTRNWRRYSQNEGYL